MMKYLLAIAFDWGIRCFGRDHMMNLAVRSLRIVEEAIELCQAYDVPETKVHECVAMVYSRPKGAPYQEMGGVLLTAFELCAAREEDPIEVFTVELRRVLGKPAKHFTERNEEKLALGMDAGPKPTVADEPPSAQRRDM
jgi:hypothetical protein